MGRTVLFGLGLLALTAVAVGAAVFSSNNRVWGPELRVLGFPSGFCKGCKGYVKVLRIL